MEKSYYTDDEYCEVCGNHTRGNLITYFVDNDPTNTNSENVKTVCRQCHKRLRGKSMKLLLNLYNEETGVNTSKTVTEIFEGRGSSLPTKDIWNNYDIIILEGYECTGKSTTAKVLRNNMYASTYRPSYEQLNIDEYLPRNERFLLGIAVIDNFLQNKRKNTPPLLLDRGIFSSIVYGNFYSLSDEELTVLQKGVESMRTLFDKCRVLVIYKYHPDIDSAKAVHEAMMKYRSSDMIDKYDDTDFDKYLENYTKFNKMYIDSFKQFEVDVVGIQTETQSSVVINDTKLINN